MNHDNTRSLVDGYLEHYRKASDEEGLFQYWLDVKLLVGNDPRASIELIVGLLKACVDDKEIAYVAAGPVEDFFSRWGRGEFAEELRSRILADPRIKIALDMVWE